MRILIDCFGCDNPKEWTKGIADAINKIDGVEIIAVGDKDFIEDALKGETFDRGRLEIVHTTEIITNDDFPAEAIRKKRDSSLVRALKMLRDDDTIKAFISAGSTGAVLVGGIVIIGNCEGVERPGLSAFMPCDNGKTVCVADCGANMDCDAENLLDFARYGSSYIKSVYGIEKPAVALLSVGVEDKKGNNLSKEAFALLKESGLNFVGNMEARDALSGKYDVIVTDGFPGNVLIKSYEGAAKTVSGMLAGYLMKNAPKDVDLTFIKKSFGELGMALDTSSTGGAVLLGLKKIVIKSHGNATAINTVNSVKQAKKMVEGGYLADLG